MLILPGAAALTPFRQQRLLQQLRALHPNVTDVVAHWAYVVAVAEETLSDADTQTLMSLLDATPPAAVSAAALQLRVGPRAGTISPWSSKATDILHNAGLTQVQRVERLTVYTVQGLTTLPALISAAVLDRMTEQLFADDDALAALMAQTAPRPQLRQWP